MSFGSLGSQEWKAAIELKLSTTRQMVMFDTLTATEEQKRLLYQILFQDHTSVQFWSEYLRYIVEKVDNFNSICRLFNFAFTFIDKAENYQSEVYVKLCLFKARYFGTHGKDPRKIYRDMEKKKIGTLDAEFYLYWSECESKYDEELARLIVEKGIKRGAQPKELLVPIVKKRKEIQYDDGEVVVDKKLKRVEPLRSQSTATQNITERPSKPQLSSQTVNDRSQSDSNTQNNVTETMNPVTTLEIARPETVPSMLSSFKEIQVNRRPYLQLDGVLGKGASSSVCRVIALTPSTTDDGKSSAVEIFAFKRILIREDSDEVFDSFANEINLLKSCVGSPYIIQLVDSEVNRKEMHVSMVLELGEVDLATAINNAKKLSTKVNPFFMRMVWERMLLAVDYIHERRIVHGDLKPANFVFVKGQLKLIDFGISKEMSNDTTNIVRNGLIGTINYMAPEAIMPLTVPSTEESDDDDEDDVILNKKKPKVDHIIKHGRASDVWSLGCILYQMLYGKTPFASVRNIQQKVAMITNPNAEIPYPPVEESVAIDVVKRCLVREVRQRATIKGGNGLLSHPFLKSDNKEKSTCDQSTNTDQIILLPPPPPPRQTNIPPKSIIESPVIPLVVETPKIGSSLRPTHRQPLQKLPLNIDNEERHQSSEQNVRNGSTLLDPQDFKNGRLKLRESVTSSSSKWMKPKGSSPEKKDLQSILEKQLGVMRKFLAHDDDMTVGSNFDQEEF